MVSGRVTDAETGAPLARVDLSLTLLGTRAQLDTTSDAEGGFQFRRLPAGKYSLIADPTKRGSTHRPGSYRTGPLKPGLQWSTIVLRDGEAFDQAHIALPRGFVITARVMDEDGLPVADALVKAEAVETGGGFSTRSRTTDDLGAVRLWGYSPGTYRVCATPRSMGSDSHGVEGYIETCYPSVPESEAQPIAVTTADPPEVEIRLRRSRLFRISGVVVDANGQPAAAVSVSLVTLEKDGASSRTIPNVGGGFLARGLVPGDYIVKAEPPLGSDPDDTTRPIGSAAVHLQSADAENVVVVLSQPAVVRGRLVFDGGQPPPVGGLTVQAYPARGTIASAAARRSPPARVNADLSFELRGLFGPRTIDVTTPSDWVVKSVKYRGQERINLPTEFTSQGDPSALEIVLTNRPATLIARVLSDTGSPMENARVLLFPTDPNQWNGTARLSIWRMGTRKGDHYEFRGLRPAEYFVAVLPDGMPFTDRDIRALEELAKTAERITLLENDQKAMDLAIRR